MPQPNRSFTPGLNKARTEVYDPKLPKHLQEKYDRIATEKDKDGHMRPAYQPNDSKLSPTEIQKYKEMVKALNNQEQYIKKHEAIRAFNVIEDAFKEKRISQAMLKACLVAQDAKFKDEERKRQFLKAGDKFYERAQANKGQETPIDRMVTLAKFNPEALAAMMLFDDIYFLINLLFSVTGLPLVSEMQEFEKIKAENPDAVFDPSDEKWAYPQGNSPEAQRRREQTEKNLLNLGLYHFTWSKNREFKLVGEPIKDPREVTYDICLANGIIHKPSTMVCVRKSTIEFCVKMLGESADPMYWIQKQLEGQSQSGQHNRQNSAYNEAEASAFLGQQAAARSVPQGR